MTRDAERIERCGAEARQVVGEALAFAAGKTNKALIGVVTNILLAIHRAGDRRRELEAQVLRLEERLAVLEARSAAAEAAPDSASNVVALARSA